MKDEVKKRERDGVERKRRYRVGDWIRGEESEVGFKNEIIA